MFIILLLAQFWIGELKFSDNLSPEILKWFHRAKVGDIAEIGEQCGCNICYRSVRKISDTHIRDFGIFSQTMMACGPYYMDIEVK